MHADDFHFGTARKVRAFLPKRAIGRLVGLSDLQLFDVRLYPEWIYGFLAHIRYNALRLRIEAHRLHS